MKFIIRRGIYEEEIEADAVEVICPVGEFELHWRSSDKELSLSCDGQLFIEPRASNVVRLWKRETTP